MSSLICRATALLAHDPEFFDRLTPEERLVALYDHALWLRPEQIVPPGRWRSFGMIAGRGFGKSHGIACEINDRAERGDIASLALAAPSEDRVRDVQVKLLIETSPPWFRAKRYGKHSLRWPSGLTADVFSSERGGKPRGGTFAIAWLTELVDWKDAGRLELHDNLATATRAPGAQLFWDTTSKGRNDLIQFRLAEVERAPAVNLIRRGTTFDNPLLEQTYLQETCSQYVVGSRRFREELLGEVFLDSAGALWRTEWIDRNRVQRAPDLEISIVSLDPALSDSARADETGMVVGGRVGEYCYVTDDLSGKMMPDEWARIAVEECVRGAAGITIEINNIGMTGRALIKAHAERRNLKIRLIGKDIPFPKRTPGVLYLREHTSTRSKTIRAEAPAALYAQNRVHHVGDFPDLEMELTTWDADSRKSPNRLDALAFLISELADLHSPGTRPTPELDLASAREAQRSLKQRLRGGGRRLGL